MRRAATSEGVWSGHESGLCALLHLTLAETGFDDGSLDAHGAGLDVVGAGDGQWVIER